MYVTVKNGTNAGRRRVHELVAWVCAACGTKNEPFWGTCKDCNRRKR